MSYKTGRTATNLPSQTFVPLQRTSDMHSVNKQTNCRNSIPPRPGIYPTRLGRLFAQCSPSSEQNRPLAKRMVPPKIQVPGTRKQDEGKNNPKHNRGEDDDMTPPVSNKTPKNPKRCRRSSSSHKCSLEKAHHNHSFVHHEYHDYSGLSGTATPPILCKKGRGGVSSMFPTVLHHMLNEAEKNGFAYAVSWQPHGRAFHVHDPEKFVKDIMPLYFRHTRFSSFQRQLSLYGFVRLTRKGPDRGAYYHECFLRGLPHLCSNMQRTRVKGTVVRQSSSPEREPHFETMPPVGADHASAYINQRLNAAAASLKVNRTFCSEKFFPSLTLQGEQYKDQLGCMPPPKGGTNKTSQETFDHLPEPSVSQKQQVEMPSNTTTRRNSSALGRKCSSKYMRYLMCQTEGRLQKSEEASQERKSIVVPQLQPLNSGLAGDVDLANFLQGVDLESDTDEAFESEEAMARILEQDLTQIKDI